MRPTTARRIVRWTSSVAFVVAGLYFLNGAAFHAWAGGGGPPTPRPEWHRAWVPRFVALAMICFFLAGLVFWRFRPKSGTPPPPPP